MAAARKYQDARQVSAKVEAEKKQIAEDLGVTITEAVEIGLEVLIKQAIVNHPDPILKAAFHDRYSKIWQADFKAEVEKTAVEKADTPVPPQDIQKDAESLIFDEFSKEMKDVYTDKEIIHRWNGRISPRKEDRENEYFAAVAAEALNRLNGNREKVETLIAGCSKSNLIKLFLAEQSFRIQEAEGA